MEPDVIIKLVTVIKKYKRFSLQIIIYYIVYIIYNETRVINFWNYSILYSKHIL